MSQNDTRIVVALGRQRDPALEEPQQLLRAVRERPPDSRQVAQLIAEGYQPIFTHGNGTAGGNLLIQNEAAAKLVPSVPLDVCGAETQGQIGYMIQQALANELRAQGIRRPVASVITQVLVDADDPAFTTPTKPVGPFLPRESPSRGCGIAARRGSASTTGGAEAGAVAAAGCGGGARRYPGAAGGRRRRDRLRRGRGPGAAAAGRKPTGRRGGRGQGSPRPRGWRSR